MIVVVVHDAQGSILSVASASTPAALSAYLDLPNALFLERDEPIDSDAWKINPATKQLIAIQAPPAPTQAEQAATRAEKLAKLKERLAKRIDEEAEAARQLYVTPGDGQVMEYLATEAEAIAVLAGSMAPAPFLQAELQARQEAAGESWLTLMAVAAEAALRASEWRSAAAQIKMLRRRGKLAVAAAANRRDAIDAATIVWPMPV